jgi:hypothetical protein
MERDQALSFRMAFTVLAVSLGFSTQALAFTFDTNVPAAIQQQMKDDLVFMNGIQGASVSPLHKQIYGDVSGKDYEKFFSSRVTAIGLNSCGGGNAVACVIPFFDSSKMWITENYIKFSHPQVARLMVVYHEARHTEDDNWNWGHATCPKPFLDENGQEMKSIWTGAPLAGEAACDVTPMGSYGSSTIMLKNIAKNCANCSEKVKMDAAMYADNQLGRITDAKAKSDIVKDIF